MLKRNKFLILCIVYVALAVAVGIRSYTWYQKELQYQAAIEEAYIQIDKKDWETAALAGMIEMLTDEYNKLYEAYCKCCEPKVAM